MAATQCAPHERTAIDKVIHPPKPQASGHGRQTFFSSMNELIRHAVWQRRLTVMQALVPLERMPSTAVFFATHGAFCPRFVPPTSALSHYRFGL